MKSNAFSRCAERHFARSRGFLVISDDSTALGEKSKFSRKSRFLRRSRPGTPVALYCWRASGAVSGGRVAAWKCTFRNNFTRNLGFLVISSNFEAFWEKSKFSKFSRKFRFSRRPRPGPLVALYCCWARGGAGVACKVVEDWAEELGGRVGARLWPV